MYNIASRFGTNSSPFFPCPASEHIQRIASFLRPKSYATFISYFILYLLLFISVFLFRLDAACFYEGPSFAIFLWISVLLWSCGVSVLFMVALDHSVRCALYVVFMFYDRLFRYCFSAVIKILWSRSDWNKASNTLRAESTILNLCFKVIEFKVAWRFVNLWRGEDL